MALLLKCADTEDYSISCLAQIQSVCSIVPVPFLSVAADTLQSILKTVAKVSENTEQFRNLAERAAQIFLAITAQVNNGVQVDERLLSNVKELERCVLII